MMAVSEDTPVWSDHLQSPKIPMPDSDISLASVPSRRRLLFRDYCLIGAVSMSQLLDEYFLTGFIILVPRLTTEFSIPQESITWPASAYSLAVSALLLFFGRLSDVYGSYVVYTAGLIWLTFWSLICGFVSTEIMLNISRAMQGVAAAAYLSSSLPTLSMTNNPDLSNSDLVFFIYGAMAPLGTFLGILSAALTLQFASWKWFFWIGSILAGLSSLLIVVLGIPNKQNYEMKRRRHDVSVDWLGSGLLIVGLTLSIFSLTQVSYASQGWRTWYIIFSLVLGSCLLACFVFVEMKIAQHPVIPRELWEIPSMPAFCIALLFNYGTTNVFLLYATLYFVDILRVEPILLAAWFAPMAVGGCLLAVVGGFVFKYISARMILILTGFTTIAASLILAVSPVQVNYWPWIFLAMICTTLSIDLIFNVANIFLLKSCPEEHQGSAGGLANMLVQLSGAILLAFAQMLLTYTQSSGTAQAYKNVFWLSVACGCVASVIFMGFVRIKTTNSRG